MKDIDVVSLWDFECVYNFAQTVFLFRLKGQDENDRRVLQINLGMKTYHIDIVDRFLKFTPFDGVDIKNEHLQNFYRGWVSRKLDDSIILDAMIDFHTREELKEK